MERIKPSDAATLLGVPAQAVRVGLQRNQLPFGTAIKGAGRFVYVIYPEKLRECVGKEVYDTWAKSRS